MNETLKVLNDLHTTHGNFTDKEIDDLTLKSILETSVRGANASNRQSYSIIVIRGKEKTEKITGYGAPVALLVCVDFNRLYDIGEQLGYPSDYDNLFNYFTAHTDAWSAPIPRSNFQVSKCKVFANKSLHFLITNLILFRRIVKAGVAVHFSLDYPEKMDNLYQDSGRKVCGAGGRPFNPLCGLTVL